jgi:hypothetical protein
MIIIGHYKESMNYIYIKSFELTLYNLRLIQSFVSGHMVLVNL